MNAYFRNNFVDPLEEDLENDLCLVKQRFFQSFIPSSIYQNDVFLFNKRTRVCRNALIECFPNIQIENKTTQK